MELRDLEALVAVAEQGSVTRAAALLQVAQPALSRRLQALEREVGVSLLRRAPRGAVPTAAGDELVRRGRRLLRGAAAAVEAARDVAAAGDMLLRLGTFAYADGPAVEDLLSRIAAAVPGLVVERVPAMVGDRLDEVLDGVLDASLVRRGRVEDPALQLRLLWHDSMRAAVPADHPLAARPAVGLHELAELPLLFYPPSLDVDLHAEVLRCLAAAGAHPPIRTGGTTAFDNLPAVAKGGCWTLVSTPLADSVQVRGVTLLPLVGPAPRMPLAVVWRRDDRRPALMALGRV